MNFTRNTHPFYQDTVNVLDNTHNCLSVDFYNAVNSYIKGGKSVCSQIFGQVEINVNYFNYDDNV